MSLAIATASSSSLNVMTDEHRPEDFLLRDAHVVADAGEDGRLDEPAVAALRPGGRAAAQHALGALALGDVDVGEDLLVLRRRRDRADLRLGAARIAHAARSWPWRPASRRTGRGSTPARSRREPAMQVCPVAAKMPEIAPLTASSRIAVVEHDVGRLAAELQRHLFEGLGRQLVDPARRWRPTPVKATLATFGMGRRAVRRPRRRNPVTTLTTPGGRPDSSIDQLHEFEQSRPR